MQGRDTPMTGLDHIAATLAPAERNDDFFARHRRASSWCDERDAKGGAA
jgi:hypothetical protein